MKPEDLNQSHDLPHNDRPTPDKSPSFNVCFVLVIEASGGCICTYLQQNIDTKYHREIDSKFV